MVMPDKDPAIREQLLHSIKMLTRATIALFISILLVTSLGFYEANREREALEKETERTVSALCAFTHDLQVRYDNGVKFLEDNPEGIPGLSAEFIQNQLNNQQRTLTALGGLPCSGT